jgi:hypothetical protein
MPSLTHRRTDWIPRLREVAKKREKVHIKMASFWGSFGCFEVVPLRTSFSTQVNPGFYI